MFCEHTTMLISEGDMAAYQTKEAGLGNMDWGWAQ